MDPLPSRDHMTTRLDHWVRMLWPVAMRRRSSFGESADSGYLADARDPFDLERRQRAIDRRERDDFRIL